MRTVIKTICALCAITALCEQTTADSPFFAPVRMITGLEIALAVLRIIDSARAILLPTA